MSRGLNHDVEGGPCDCGCTPYQYGDCNKCGRRFYRVDNISGNCDNCSHPPTKRTSIDQVNRVVMAEHNNDQPRTKQTPPTNHIAAVTGNEEYSDPYCGMCGEMHGLDDSEKEQ